MPELLHLLNNVINIFDMTHETFLKNPILTGKEIKSILDYFKIILNGEEILASELIDDRKYSYQGLHYNKNTYATGGDTEVEIIAKYFEFEEV